MTNGRCSLVLAASLLVGCVAAPARERENPPSRTLSVEEFYAGLEGLISRYFPAAKFERTQDGIHFEHDTRIFLVHEALKTGKWQEAFEERGPNRGGILGDVTLEKGPYQGAAEVPQTFDKRYFKLLLMAPDLPALEAHMRVELWYPPSVSPDFLAEFTRLVDGLSS